MLAKGMDRRNPTGVWTFSGMKLPPRLDVSPPSTQVAAKTQLLDCTEWLRPDLLL